MFLFSNTNKLIKRELNNEFYHFRFLNHFDIQSREFEDNKIRLKHLEKHSIIDEEGIVREILWPNMSYWQSYHYLENQNNSFYFLQMSNKQTNRHYQIAITVEISKIKLFKTGTIRHWIMDTKEESKKDQHELIKLLKYFCKEHTDLMCLRIQPYMPGEKKLEYTHGLLSNIGFSDVSPKSYTKTRMIDLRPPVEEILCSFSTNGRARLKIKTKDKELVEVKEIIDHSAIPFLQDALDASYLRSVDKKCAYDFIPLFLSASRQASRVIMLGFYFKDIFLEPKAFVTGISHGNIVEYSVGGSCSDARLRKFPFNHILLWQLAIRAKQNGSELLDMGGTSSGKDDDALRGITAFKRLFPGFELTVGREMESPIRPKFIFFYTIIRNFIKLMNKLPLTP